MRLESLSYHYPDDPLAGAVSNDALEIFGFYGVEQDLVNNQDTFWINGKVVGEVNLRGGGSYLHPQLHAMEFIFKKW